MNFAQRPFFAILIAMSAVGPLSLNIFIPSMPGLQRSFDISYGTAQLTLTLYLIGMALCQLIYGPLSDRYGRRPMLLIGMSLFVIASISAALAQSIGMLIIARLLQAIGGASGIVLGRAMVRDVYPREKAASVISYITMAFVVAPMVAPVIGGFLDGSYGWRTDFWLLTAIGCIVLIAARFMLPETHVNRSGMHRGPGFIPGAIHLLKIARYRGYVLTLAFASSVFFAFLGGAPHVMEDVLGRTPFEYGQWFILISAAYMTGNFLSGRYTMRLGIDRIMLAGNVLTLIGGLLCFMAAMADILSPASIFVPMAVAALGNGLTIPNGTTAAISVDLRMTGAAAGLAGFLQMGWGAAASQLVGSLQDGWPTALFWYMAIASLLALAVHGIAMLRESQVAGEAAE